MIVFTASFGYIGSTVMIHLGGVFYPGKFPVAAYGGEGISMRLLLIEIGREAAIFGLIFSAAWLMGRDRRQRVAYFMVIFALWNIFYYVWLKVLINWPTSLMDWDILLFVPITCASPVFCRLLISLTMLVFAVVILCCSSFARPIRATSADWFAFSLSGVIMLEPFFIAGLHITQKDYASHFNPWLFSAGYLLAVVTFLLCLLKTILKPQQAGRRSPTQLATPVEPVEPDLSKIKWLEGKQKALLGVSIAENRLVKRLGLEGVLTVYVKPGGAAERAGLRSIRRNERGKIELGDLIVAINDMCVRRPRDLLRVLAVRRAGDTVRLRVRRKNSELDLNVKL